jgi:hypothetical protein
MAAGLDISDVTEDHVTDTKTRATGAKKNAARTDGDRPRRTVPDPVMVLGEDIADYL